MGIHMKRIFIVDDDAAIGNMLEKLLTGEGYLVSRAYSGTEALMLLSQQRPDLILLDLMLPGLDGKEVLQRIQGIPVIIISAKIDIDSKVSLLLDGAADYITKPFHTKELLARIQVQLRQAALLPSSVVLTFEDVRLDSSTHEAAIADTPLKLTPTEYAILKALLERPSQVITKTVLLERLSEETPDCTDISLKMHISNLRRKMRAVNGRDYIEAVWGIGFKMRQS